MGGLWEASHFLHVVADPVGGLGQEHQAGLEEGGHVVRAALFGALRWHRNDRNNELGTVWVVREWHAAAQGLNGGLSARRVFDQDRGRRVLLKCRRDRRQHLWPFPSHMSFVH